MLKSIQTQSPLCIAAVIKYLDESGPLPFIIHKNDDSGIRILKEEFNSNKSYNLTIRNELPKSGSFLIALPSKRFQGAKIQISGHDSYKLDKNDSNYSQWISSASGYVLSVTSLPSQEVTIEISPGSQGFIINGSIASQGIRKPDLTKLSGVQNTQIISILSPTLESAEKILERVDESWDNAVDRVAGSINHSRSLARKGASKIVTLAKLILFH